jgi:tetratricopeptide (TPR) repeat protein
MNARLIIVSLVLVLNFASRAQDTLIHHMDYYFSAQLLYDRQSYQAAIHNMDLAIMKNKAGEYFKLRGDAHHKLGNFQLALADYNQAAKKLNDPELYLNRAICRVSLEDFQEGVLDLYRYLKFEPESPKAFYYLAVIDYYTFNYKGALDYLENVMSLDEDFMPAYYLEGAVLAELKKYDEAIESYNIALDLEPTFFRARLNIANVLSAQGRYDEAHQLLELLLDEPINFFDEVYYAMAENKHASGDKNGACEFFEMAADQGDADAKINVERFCRKNEKKHEKKRKAVKASF